MTLVRRGVGWLHEDHTCSVPECGSLQPAAPGEIELPRQAAELRAKAETYRAIAKRLDADADALDVEHAKITLVPWLCQGHLLRIYDHALLERWPGGLLASSGTEGKRVLAATLADIAKHDTARGTIGAGVYQ